MTKSNVPKNLRFHRGPRIIARLGLILLTVFALAGCDSCGEKDGKDEGKADVGSQLADMGPDAAEHAVGELPVTAENINPIIQHVGSRESIPTAITAEFATPILDDAPRMASEATVFRISPDTTGQLKFSGNSTLVFTPDNPLKPSTTYRVELSAIESKDGKIVPAEPWRHEFSTPAFDFLGLAGAVLDDSSKTVYVDMKFSAPFDSTSLEKNTMWYVGERKISNVVYETSKADPNLCNVVIKDKALNPGTTLTVKIDEGVQFMGDSAIQAGAGEASVELIAGPEVEIFAAGKQEGPTGFYVEFVCKDDGAPGGTRWYWDRRTYNDYRISRRCLPTAESAKRSIQINPKVDFEVVPGKGGFNLIGDFKRGTYTVVVEGGLTTIDGGILKRSYESKVNIPARSAKINFANKGRYIPRSRWNKVALRHLNAPEVEVQVSHIPERNLIHWLNQSSENSGRNIADVIAKERIDLEGKEDKEATSLLYVANFIGEPQSGVYEVRVGTRGASDALRLMVTDMNLIVKTSELKPDAKWAEDTFVWAIDMSTTQPISGVKIEAVKRSGTPMATCTTDDQGGCNLKLPPMTIDPNGPFAILARKDKDFTYLAYDELVTDPGSADIHGEKFYTDAAYRAAIYSDRDLYRPAETAHLVAILRDRNHVAPNAGVPVEVAIRDPRGQDLRREVRKTNAAGVLTLDETFGDFAATGAYTVTLSVAKRAIGTYRFKVEEFVPERMKVTAKSAEKGYLPDAQTNIDVEAEYLFGGSAKGSAVEVTCRLEPVAFTPEKRRDFTFGLATQKTGAVDLGIETGELDEEGKARVRCPQIEDTGFASTARLTAYTAVMEAGSGRTSNAVASAMVHPETYYLGLKSKGTKVQPGKSFSVDGVVVDWDGDLAPKAISEVDVQFIRLDREYYWYYSDDDAQNAWGQNIRPVVEATRTFKVKDGKFRISGEPGRDSSAYVVRVTAGDTTTDYRFEGARSHGYWWYSSRDRTDNTPRPGRPTHVPIQTPELLEVEKPSEFTFEVPFKGRMLVTAETSSVITHEWHEVEAGPFKWKFVLGEFSPTVYVSAMLVKDPHLDSKETFLPDRAFGVEPVRVKPTKQTHGVTISVPDKIEPNTTLDVEVDVSDVDGSPTFVTVAAIDEGILSLTKYETPEPNKSLFAKRALGVRTYETIGWALASNPAGPSSATGGGDDGEYDEDDGDMRRVMPIKPVALWSDLVPVDAKTGKARVSFEVPRYRGALRVMAVAASGTRTGSAEARVTVRDPLVLTTTLPRFLSAGDVIHIPVFVTNMTGKDGQASVTLSADSEPTPGLAQFSTPGAVVEMLGDSTKAVSLSKNESGTVVFAVRALRQAGTARFKIEAKLGAITSYDEGIVPFRPSGPHERIVTRVKLKPGENDLTAALSGWVETSEKSTIWVTANPYGESFDHLKYLVRYPYGCIEQTTSSTRPLLYVSEFVDLIDPEFVAKRGNIEDMVKHGIKRVLSMQTPSGGFAYWPGGSSPDAWGTAFASHMLLDAKDQGFDVPSDRLDRAISYLESTADALERGQAREWYRYSEPYIHFVLAKAGKGKRARILRLLENPAKAPKGHEIENDYMLKAALYIAGDRRYEAALKKIDVGELATNQRKGRWVYYSDARRRAFVLSTFHDLFGNDPAGEELARAVGDHLAKQRSSYYTTQEITWGITGLGKWVQGAASKFDVPELKLADRKVKPQAAPKKRNDRTWAIHRASEYPVVTVDIGNTDGNVFAIVSSEGVRKNSEPAYGGKGLKIARKFRNLAGDDIEPDGHKLGDVVYSEITVTNTSGRPLYNLALVDRFAGGWEVENPRLGRGTLPDWVESDAMWNVEHMNIRDDRVEVFGAIPAGQSVTFIYAVRSTSAGEFLAPPPEIAGMYDPEVWAREQPARVTVDGPWKDFLN